MVLTLCPVSRSVLALWFCTGEVRSIEACCVDLCGKGWLIRLKPALQVFGTFQLGVFRCLAGLVAILTARGLKE